MRKLIHNALLLFILAGIASLNVATAQQTASGEESDISPSAQAVTDGDEIAVSANLAEQLSQIAQYEDTLQQLQAGRAQAEGLRREMMDAQIFQTLSLLISSSQATANDFLDRQPDVAGLDTIRARIVEAVAALPSLIAIELANLRANLQLPQVGQTALELSGVFAELEVRAKEYDELIDALIANNDLAAKLGMDTSSTEATVKHEVIRGGEGASLYLSVIMSHLDRLRRQSAALPGNDELKAKIAATEQHIKVVADILRKRSRRMADFGIDVAWIDTQLISATGALSTEILSWTVITRLAGDFFTGITDWLADNGSRILLQILVFIAILAITWKLARLVEVLTRRTLEKMQVSLSQLLKRMIVSIARSIILALGVLIGLSQLGVSLGPLLAGLGIAGFIIGFALQDSLSNFASGLMILLYRPFDIGDVVDVNGAFGKVRQMSLVNTTVLTFDNQTLVVPNNQIWQNVIKNLTNQEIRRVDMVFGISYGDEIEKAERVLGEIVASDEMVLEDPAPVIRLHELGESSVNFIVRPWVKTEDYWDAYWNITRQVKLRFDAEGITIPFPQRDVHHYTHAQPGPS